MFCKECGNKLDVGSRVCHICNPSFNKVETPNNVQFQDHYSNRNNNNSTWKIVAISLGSLFAVMVVGFISYFFLFSGKNNAIEKEQQADAAVASKEVNNDNVQEELDRKALLEENERLKQELDNKELLQDNELLRDRLNSLNQKVQSQGSTNSASYYGNSYNITWSDLDGLSKWDIDVLRNEIYARHGYIFKEKQFKDYFASMSWYRPNVNFHEGLFNSMEKSNLNTMIEYEQYYGWR